jgi:Na+/H+ antiporter NhaD/arsenite permease-like protein
MSEYIYRLNKKILLLSLDTFKKDAVFTISFLLALISCFFYAPKLEYIDFKVLFSLFNLMLVVKAFEELKILDKFAIAIVNKCSNYRRISLVLILLCFFSSMFITNDVALITFVPLTLIIARKTGKSTLETVILQTLAANIGSSLTPMGNPQNLFIFTYYRLTAGKFFASVGLFVILGGIWLYLLNIRIKRVSIDVKLSSVKIENKRDAVYWAAVFCIITASILGVINYYIALAITILAVVLLNKKLLMKIDYLLLVTFICFFILIGNVSNIEFLHGFMSERLKTTTSVYFSSIVFSQFISNVPSAILLSNFTNNWVPLLVGVNLGGMGTIIASLASVISYKLYIKDNEQESKNYIIRFSIYNFISLVFLGSINYFALRIIP